MRRRREVVRPRRDPGPVRVDLDESPEAGPPVPATATHPATAAASGPVPTDLTTADPAESPARRAARRRWTVAVAGVLVLLLSGMVVVDRVEARRAEQALRDAPGGVLSLDEPPEELWSVPVQDVAYTTLPGMVVVRARDGLVAHDLDSGDERWRVGVEAATCTGWEYAWMSRTPEALACLDSVRNPSQVTVVADDGEVVTVRDLDPARGAAWVGPRGTVVRAALVGGTSPISGAMGSDVMVVLEDAISGEPLWEERIVTEPGGGPEWCAVGSGEIPEDAVGVTSGEGLFAFVDGPLLGLSGCGTLGATYDAEGVRLDDPLDPTDFVSALPDGTVARVSQDGGASWRHTTVLDETGAPSWEVSGVVQAPGASDGQGQDVHFVVSGTRWETVDPDGTPLWASDVPTNGVAVQTRGAATVLSGSRVVSLDPESGDVLWEGWRDSSRRAPLVGSFTDGRIAIFLFRDAMTGDALLEAWDLEDGRVVWESGAESGDWIALEAIQGRLFWWEGDALTRLG